MDLFELKQNISSLTAIVSQQAGYIDDLNTLVLLHEQQISALQARIEQLETQK